MSKRILLIIGGGIAAYKSLELIRRLKESGLGVRVVMSEAASPANASSPICSTRRRNSMSATSGWRASATS
jgi:hypothetical protein